MTPILIVEINDLSLCSRSLVQALRLKFATWSFRCQKLLCTAIICGGHQDLGYAILVKKVEKETQNGALEVNQNDLWEKTCKWFVFFSIFVGKIYVVMYSMENLIHY